MSDSIPPRLKQLRACMLCGMIKTFDQFRLQGCTNCERYLALRDDSDKILECTSVRFSGMIGMGRPQESWVARWQRMDRAAPGLYAGKVLGRLPEGVTDDLEARGIPVPGHLRE